MSTTLQDKFFGCICGCHIGSAMGAPVEGMTYEEIDRKYGYVEGYSRRCQGCMEQIREPECGRLGIRTV